MRLVASGHAQVVPCTKSKRANQYASVLGAAPRSPDSCRAGWAVAPGHVLAIMAIAIIAIIAIITIIAIVAIVAIVAI